MIRAKHLTPRLFYAGKDLVGPSRASSFWQQLEAVVGDWQKLAAPLAKAFCARLGRPVDPVVYLKLELIGYLEGITHDTELAERVADSLALRRFLGYDVDEATPDHASISRNRKKLARGRQVEQVLAAVVARCVKAELVSGEEVAGDSTLVAANASLRSLRSRPTGESVRDYLKAARARNREEGKKTAPTVSNAEFRSRSDPDARLAKKPGQARDLCYQVTHVTDGKAQVILAVACEEADRGESETIRKPLQEAKRALKRAGKGLGRVVADAGYDDGALHAFIEDLGGKPITNYQPDTSDKPEGFKKADFLYQAETDSYQCPGGRQLPFRSETAEGERSYRAAPTDCAVCPHRESCLSKTGERRSITRRPHEASRERMLARVHTEEGRAALRRRRHIVEPPFAHLKCHGGLALIACRRKRKARVKAVLGAVAWNLLKLLKDHRRKLEAQAVASAASVAGHVAPLLTRVRLHRYFAEARFVIRLTG
jgi:transposase